MKTTLTLLAAVLVGFAGAAGAQTTSAMQGMQQSETAVGTGVIKAIDKSRRSSKLLINSHS